MKRRNKKKGVQERRKGKKKGKRRNESKGLSRERKGDLLKGRKGFTAGKNGKGKNGKRVIEGGKEMAYEE